MSNKAQVVIGSFGPSARQIGEAARAVCDSAEVEVVVRNRPQKGDTVYNDRKFEGRRFKDLDRGLAYLHDLCERRGLVNQVFLGGACNPTTWRQDTAIPMLEEAGVAYFNPQVDDWSERHAALIAEGVAGGMMEHEATQKTTSFVLLFVFSDKTRADQPPPPSGRSRGPSPSGEAASPA